MNNKIIFIVGPTAVGKSSVAVFLAKHLQGEIISCDSMQVYQEAPIACNHPDQKQLDAVPHHLLGFLSMTEEFDVARFNGMAQNILEQIFLRKKIPIVCGGSGLYMQILLDGIFEGAPRDEAYREELRQIALGQGAAHLHAELEKKDSAAALKIHPNDLKRIIRGLEVWQSQQQPISQLQKNRQGWWGKYDIRIFGLRMNRESLYELTNQRVEQMIATGLINEIKGLEEKVLSSTADQVIGVREIRSYLKGEKTLVEALELMKQNTRHLVKRQMTWFRKEKRIEWVDVDSSDTVEAIAERIIDKIL